MALLSKLISWSIILFSLSPQIRSLISKSETCKEAEESPEEASEQALLTEYQVCQHEATATGNYTWQSGVIFFVTALALAGAMISGITNVAYNPYRLFLIGVFGLFSIILLFVWDKYLIRQNFIRKVMFYRMEMIERQLNLKKNLYVSFLDKTIESNPLGEEEKSKLLHRFENNRGRKPQGLRWTRFAVWVTFSAWLLFMIWEALFFICPAFRSWALMTN